MYKLFIAMILLMGISWAEYYYENGKKIELVKVSESRNINGESLKTYKTQFGREVIVQDKIILQMNDGFSLNEIIKKFPVEIADTTISKIKLLAVKPGNDIFKVARDLYEDSSVKFAHPDLIRERRVR